MEFSVWHILGLVPIAIGIASVALSHGDQAIGRIAFVVRLFVLCAFGLALMFVLRQRDENIAVAVMLLYLLCVSFLIPYWATERLRDMGIRHKYWAVLTVVPAIGWIYTIYLIFARGAGDPSVQEDDDLPPLIRLEEPEIIESSPRGHMPRRIA